MNYKQIIIIIFLLFSVGTISVTAYSLDNKIFYVGDSMVTEAWSDMEDIPIQGYPTEPFGRTPSEWNGRRLADEWAKGESCDGEYCGYTYITASNAKIIVIGIGTNDINNLHLSLYPTHTVADVITDFTDFYDDLIEDIPGVILIQVFQHVCNTDIDGDGGKFGAIAGGSASCTSNWEDCADVFNRNYQAFVDAMIPICHEKGVLIANLWQWEIDHYVDTDSFADHYLSAIDGRHPGATYDYWEEIMWPIINKAIKERVVYQVGTNHNN